MDVGGIGGGSMAAYASSMTRANSGSVEAAAAPLASEGPQATVNGSLLKMAMDGQVDLIMKLLSVNLQNQAIGQKMEIAGQIIDAYA